MAPTTTSRTTPVGSRLTDGYQSLIAFATDADISFWELEVTPPGVDGQDEIDITTMHNTTYLTKAAQSLKDITEISCTVAYDPVVYDQIIALINVNGSITVHFSNGDTLDVFGYLKTFTPGSMVKGEMPEAEITIVVTNVDPSDNSETAPNYKTAAGTD